MWFRILSVDLIDCPHLGQVTYKRPCFLVSICYSFRRKKSTPKGACRIRCQSFGNKALASPSSLSG